MKFPSPSMSMACLASSFVPTCLPCFSRFVEYNSSIPATHQKPIKTDGNLESRVYLSKRLLLRAGIIGLLATSCNNAHAFESLPHFYDLPNSNGVKAVDVKEGTGATPHSGDKVAIHYYARLAAKQGWRFDSTYDHKDEAGLPQPYVFTLGSGTVIAGLDAAIRTMKEGGVRRVIIPPSEGYLNTTQGPIPPNFFDRQRLYTTIFNPTRLGNGEGSTLGTLVFDIELLHIRPS